MRLSGCRAGPPCAARRRATGRRPTQLGDRCRPYLVRAQKLALCPGARVLLALGAVGWDAALRALGAPRPWPPFGHGA